LSALKLYPTPSAEQVLTCITIAYFFISVNIGVYLYTPELCPTRARSGGRGDNLAAPRLQIAPPSSG
jgi:hypothetical protein